VAWSRQGAPRAVVEALTLRSGIQVARSSGMAGFVNVTRERCPRPAHRWQGRLRKALRTATVRSGDLSVTAGQKGEVGDASAPYRRGLMLPDSFYSQRVASQKTRHSLPSRGAEKTCQSSLRLLTWR
jgi:hypothetical protein